MNWIERMYDLKGKDLYSQNGEGYYLEYIAHILHLPKWINDVGGGDGFYLSNSRHLNNLGWNTRVLDKELGHNITVENATHSNHIVNPSILSIDIDGNDYWIIQEILKEFHPHIIIAEFNAAFTDSRTIKYNPNHIWDGTDYYGFSFDAGVNLAESNGYKVIFQIADMNMIMVRQDLINVSIPPVPFKQNNFFEMSIDRDWIFI